MFTSQNRAPSSLHFTHTYISTSTVALRSMRSKKVIMIALLDAKCVLLLWLIGLLQFSSISNGFVVPLQHHVQSKSPRISQPLAASTTASSSPMSESRRNVLLSRRGPYFQLDRRKGTIEFGATANLVTQLPQSDPVAIAAWLRESRGIALSIWDPKLMQDMGSNVYRLQIMTLQFVTITLAPWVDVEMTTINNSAKEEQPEFILQSVSFDPNIQVLPGLRINAESLGIVIEVAGLLRPGVDGTSVTGGIAFQTSGQLPPPMRLLPDPILQAASDSINNTIVKFVVQSFQAGAQNNFQQFLHRYRQERKELESKGF
jgi:Protein of unknown function (DUF1997)